MGKIINTKIFRWALALLWMGLIFYFSAQKGNGFHSPSTIYFLERKFFHVLEFLVLTLALFWAFRLEFSQADSAKKALIFSLIFAFSDEWHQTVVPGRDGALRDVGIDFLGVFLAIIIILNYSQWKRRWWK